ncbi:MAG: NUDIX domain-containing protein [Bacteroidales bacterium]|jgi:8-oxo-dGTP pyrophosphatase MutT (NUDIX family)|nr:NUDIX domain-containing protein [Bacteroidales bacterium]
MNKEIKIFFDDRMLVLTGKDTKIPASGKRIVFKNKKSLAGVPEKFAASTDHCLYVIHPDVDRLLEHVTSCFRCIEAAGGVVSLPDRRILLIRRLGKWDLPKGKAEKNETPEATAIREVTEECGLSSPPQITGKLVDTYHTYYQDGKHILKHTAWYSMLYAGEETLHPQTSENITRAVWCAGDQWSAAAQNTYASIRQVMDVFMNRAL